ncbi:LuxR C-terminal-related transcriptional regulator [Kitasatospora sp. NPDC098663]|uniref:LuxR C-terminal-related transcriptional regulator n=1 Tax=Kitasatospora sp. NPDC098663 TaxID=3364096 RepID=UPI003828DD79
MSDTPGEQPNLLLSLRTRAEPPAPASAPRAEVSPTEARILAAAARGDTTAQIGREIGLAADGVNYHLARLSRRWHVPNRTALVGRAYAFGVLVAEVWPPEPARRT